VTYKMIAYRTADDIGCNRSLGRWHCG